jgi:class 3 adenylate cyclase
VDSERVPPATLSFSRDPFGGAPARAAAHIGRRKPTMAEIDKEPPVSRPEPGTDGMLETAVLFVDLVASSEFASVLGLEAYANYVDSFEQLCRTQCAHFFETFHANKKWQFGRDYVWHFVGDELVVFMHTEKATQNIYQLLALAITLKCAWLGTTLNAERLESGTATAELAAGINIGNVWARASKADEHGNVRYKPRGFSINVAKRIESASREGQHFRIYMSDPAMKRVNRQARNILFSPRKILPMKGVVVPIGVYEVVDSFLDPSPRLEPNLLEGFRRVAYKALRANSYDLWIHSCLQVSEEVRNKKRITETNLDWCRRTLNIDPENASALYHAGQAMCEAKDWESARLYYKDLTSSWPAFGDGWLELGRVLVRQGDVAGARHAILQARRWGVGANEEPLPGGEIEAGVQAGNG